MTAGRLGQAEAKGERKPARSASSSNQICGHNEGGGRSRALPPRFSRLWTELRDSAPDHTQQLHSAPVDAALMPGTVRTMDGA